MSGPTAAKADRFGLPERWMFCPPMGEVVADIFFPFKTPLCGLYDAQIPERRHRFHPEDVFKSPKLNGRQIGLWVDLTKTDRFYYVNEVERHACQYKKLKMEGFGAAPADSEVKEFIRTVQQFLNKNPGKLVGVHCTHGFNRTGFAICAYLFEAMDWAIDDAIQTFARCRHNGIYKQDYITELFQRYDPTEDVLEAPDKPSWEYGEDLQLDDTSKPGTSNGSSQGTTEKASVSGHKQFMDGLVPGVYLVTDVNKKKYLQQKIKELCRYNRDDFPGLQPVSLEKAPGRDNLSLLHRRPYKVSWKADGMRYMVYIADEGEVYAFDRDNEVFHIEGLSFPHGKEPRHVRNTLVDAEMIIDKVVENGIERNFPRLLIYDIIQFENIYVAKSNFDMRSLCIYEELIKPRTEAFKEGRLNREAQPMSVRQKQFWDICSVSKFFMDSFKKNVGHEIDGLIFQPIDEPYKCGRCDTVLKWKPPSHNSIDFKLQIKKVQKPGELVQHIGYLYVQRCSEPFAQMKATKSLLPYNNKIIECTFNVQTQQFEFMRERTDKSLPNGFNTATAVFASMQNPIHQEELCRFIEKYGYRKRSAPAEFEGHPRPHKVPR